MYESQEVDEAAIGEKDEEELDNEFRSGGEDESDFDNPTAGTSTDTPKRPGWKHALKANILDNIPGIAALIHLKLIFVNLVSKD